MSISPVSSVSAVYGSQTVQNQTPASKKPTSSDQPADTVQLSSAALAHLQGGDADGDGDGH